jgi:uncharacterized delta-60 repeat protein
MRRSAVFGLLALLPSITGNAPALARAGSLDPSFGSMGRVTTSFPAGAAWGNALAIQADGKIVVAGSVDGTFALARFNPDGSLDGSFGSSGLVTTSFAEGDAAGNALAIQANGLIVAAGSAGGKFALARYTIDGSLDGSFGSSGQLTTWFAGGRAWANAVTIQTDGKIVAAGGDGRKFALARYDADGALDNRFGGDGTVRTDFGPQAKDYVIGATLQADGKMLQQASPDTGGSLSPDTAPTARSIPRSVIMAGHERALAPASELPLRTWSSRPIGGSWWLDGPVITTSALPWPVTAPTGPSIPPLVATAE